MCRKIFLFVVLQFIRTIYIEARVYCQDSNAGPWMPLGFTCPVICASIRNAIENLMMADYRNTIADQFGGRQKLSNKVLGYADYVDSIFLKNKYQTGLRKINDSIPSKTPDIKAGYEKKLFKKQLEVEYYDVTNDETTIRPDRNIFYTRYIAIFRNLYNVKGILRRSNINKNDFKNKAKNKIAGKCWYMKKFTEKMLLARIGYRPCTRKSSFDSKFIQIMTNILNKYADSLFKFTQEMTEILLENIFGSNTDLRNNIFDVNKLLKYLRKSVDLHNNHTHGHVVTLKSKKCLTLAMPGCFCKPGYVESSGQCVHPSDCVSKKYNNYLARIIVL